MYMSKKESFNDMEKIINSNLESLGNLKIEIYESLGEFFQLISKIKDCKLTNNLLCKETLNTSKKQINKLGVLYFKIKNILNSIFTLSSKFTKNIVALSTKQYSPLSNLLLDFKENKNFKQTYEFNKEAEKAINQMDLSIDLMTKIDSLIKNIYNELENLNKKFKLLLNELREIVNKNQDFNSFSKFEKEKVHNLCMFAKLLKHLVEKPLLTKENIKIINFKEIKSLNYSYYEYYFKSIVSLLQHI